MLKSRFPIFGLLLLTTGWAVAQVNVTLQLPFKQMPARVAEWRDNESLIRIVVQNTGREHYDGLMLSVELSKDGRRIARSRDGHPAQPRWSLGPGETRSLSWREVINEEAIEYDGSIRQQVITTGELPEGQYQLCIQVLSAQMRPIGPRPCSSFGIVLADPPSLIRPIGGAQLNTPMPLLEWTPSTPPAAGLQYRVTVKVRYQGQTPAQAMASNPVRLQATVPTTSYQVPVAQQLGADAADPNYDGHVWQVQALLNGRPYGRHDGISQLGWFNVQVNDKKDPLPHTYDADIDLFNVQVGDNVVKPGTQRKSGDRTITVLKWVIQYDEDASYVFSPNIQNWNKWFTVYRIPDPQHPLYVYSPNIELRNGDSLILQIKISGLESLKANGIQEVLLRLENVIPEAIRLDGGNIQTIPIRYDAISPQGTLNYTLSGISTGGYALIYASIGCQSECTEGTTKPFTELAFTVKGMTPSKETKLIKFVNFIATIAPRKTLPSRVIKDMFGAAVEAIKTRGFDVWVRVCCEECQKVPCWVVFNRMAWVLKCTGFHHVMSVDGLMNVGHGNWEPGGNHSWEEIRQKVEAVAKTLTCP